MALHDDLLAWVGRQSMAVRGGAVQVVNTANGVDWAFLVLQGAAQARTIIEARYPKPTPVVVAWKGGLRGAGFFAELPMPVGGYPVNILPATQISFEQDTHTLVVIEWTCGGARNWAYVDPAGGALALPGVEWCRVAYFSTLTPTVLAPTTAFIDASIIPSVQSGVKAYCTSQGATIGPFTLPAWNLIGAQPFQKRFSLLAQPGAPGEELEILFQGITTTNPYGLGFPQVGGTTIAAINAQSIPLRPEVLIFGGGFTAPPTQARDIYIQVEVQVC
jgi:hypothetical protein